LIYYKLTGCTAESIALSKICLPQLRQQDRDGCQPAIFKVQAGS